MTCKPLEKEKFLGNGPGITYKPKGKVFRNGPRMTYNLNEAMVECIVINRILFGCFSFICFSMVNPSCWKNLREEKILREKTLCRKKRCNVKPVLEKHIKISWKNLDGKNDLFWLKSKKPIMWEKWMGLRYWLISIFEMWIDYRTLKFENWCLISRNVNFHL